jgi:chromosome segregation ATPase
MSADDEYIPIEAAAEILRRQWRQTHRYAEQGRIRTKRAGRRVMFLKQDVEALARELNVELSPRPKPLAQLLPASDLLELVIHKDDEIRSLREEISMLQRRLGQMEGEIQASKFLLQDSHRLREDLDHYREETRRLRDELEQANRERTRLEQALKDAPDPTP